MKKEKVSFYLLIAAILLSFGWSPLTSGTGTGSIYQNILITNDNGIKDLQLLVTLAKAVSKYSDNVIVVVSNEERSGTSTHITIGKKGIITSDCIIADPENGIWVYSADGYPADCVFLGAYGIFKERGALPDLVISGINGGANEGPGWFGSGTVGAARTAAFIGLPAIAVSGIHKSDPVAQKSVSAWIAEFIKTPMVRNIKPLEYFTVSLPRDLEKIKGAKVVERDVSLAGSVRAALTRAEKSQPKAGLKYTWTLSFKPGDSNEMIRKRDLFYYTQGYIVIIPMNIDENNYSLLEEKESLDTQLPGFKILK